MIIGDSRDAIAGQRRHSVQRRQRDERDVVVRRHAPVERREQREPAAGLRHLVDAVERHRALRDLDLTGKSELGDMRRPVASDRDDVTLVRQLQQRAVADNHVDGTVGVADVEVIAVDAGDRTRALRHRADRLAARDQRVVRDDASHAHVASTGFDSHDAHRERTLRRIQRVVAVVDAGRDAFDRRRLADDAGEGRVGLEASGQEGYGEKRDGDHPRHTAMARG